MAVRWELVTAVVAGTEQMSVLDPVERRCAHDAIDDAIARRAATSSFGTQLLAEGQTIVVLAEDGTITWRTPDDTPD